jgi:hypothetical protein
MNNRADQFRAIARRIAELRHVRELAHAISINLLFVELGVAMTYAFPRIAIIIAATCSLILISIIMWRIRVRINKLSLERVTLARAAMKS